MELFSFAILAFIIGIKHAFDADHILIVSNFLSRAKKLDETLNISLSWGIGHMLTAGIMTLIIFYNRNTIPVIMLLENFEIIQIQKNRCRDCISFTKEKGIPRLKIVHGVGRGVLKSEIHSLLKGYGLLFSDGYGSTEVIIS